MSRFDPAERRKVLGASEVAQALGFSPWNTAEELRLEKLGRRAPDPENPAMRRGREMEQTTKALYTRDTGRSLVLAEKEFRDPDRPWLVCHVDSLIPWTDDCPAFPECFNGDKTGIYEGKAPGGRMAATMRENGMTPDYIHQVMASLHVANLGWASYCFLDYDAWDVTWFDVKRDQAFIDLMLTAVDNFWWHVQNDKPLGSAPAIPLDAVPIVAGEKQVLNDPELVALADEFLGVEEVYGQAKAMREAVIERMKNALLPYALCEIGGRLRVSYRPTAERRVIDADGLLEWCVNNIADFKQAMFVEYKPGGRIFRPTPIKGEQ